MKTRWLHILKEDQLQALNTKRLLNVLNSARAVESSILHYRGWRCCEMCHEYIGDDWENDVLKYSRPITIYIHKIKGILSSREHIQTKPQPTRQGVFKLKKK